MKRRVWFLLFPSCEILDIAGPMQAFHEARSVGAEYEFLHCAVGTEGGALTTAQGLGLAPHISLRPDSELCASMNRDDIVVVPGYLFMDFDPPRDLVNIVRLAHQKGAVVASICTGAFVLGLAGLLTGKVCTTHWRRTGLLQSQFPKARVCDDRLFAGHDRVYTSGGLASGIDLALHLIENDHGPLFTSKVARELVVYMRRDGTQNQTSIYLDYRTHVQPGIHAVQDHIVAHPEDRADLESLGHIARMSTRNLTRLFRNATGISLHEYRTRVRMERARGLLQNPGMTVESVASSCGFSDARQLRRLWIKHFGQAPKAYVDTYRSRSAT